MERIPDDRIADVGDICGIVMPISAIDGRDESHWEDVLDIISSAVRTAKLEPNLVSTAQDVGVIQKRIVQNLSAKNPNVMFELGLRLAFDKPTIIIKDDQTSYSFDTSPIEHLTYPRDLRFHDIVEFKDRLSEKILATLRASKENKEYTAFLGHFGTFKVAKLSEKKISESEYILDELNNIKQEIGAIRLNTRGRGAGGAEIALKDGQDIRKFADKAKRVLRRIAKERGISVRDIDANDRETSRLVEREAGAPQVFKSRDDFSLFYSTLLSTL